MHRNPAYWKETAPQSWKYINLTNQDTITKSVSISEKLVFEDNQYKDNIKNKYITVGKGYP